MQFVWEKENGSIKGVCFAQSLLVLVQQSRAQTTGLHCWLEVHMVLIQSPHWPRYQTHEISSQINGST